MAYAVGSRTRLIGCERVLAFAVRKHLWNKEALVGKSLAVKT